MHRGAARPRCLYDRRTPCARQNAARRDGADEARLGRGAREIQELCQRHPRPDRGTDPQRRTRDPLGHPLRGRGARPGGRLRDRARLPGGPPHGGPDPRSGAESLVRGAVRQGIYRGGGRRAALATGRGAVRQPQPDDQTRLQPRKEGHTPHQGATQRAHAADPRRSREIRLQRRAAAPAVAPGQSRDDVHRHGGLRGDEIRRRRRRAVRGGVETLDGRPVDHRRGARRRRLPDPPRPAGEYLDERGRGGRLAGRQRRQRLCGRRPRL